MSDDKELVEVWIEQFESWAYDYPGDALSKEYLKQAWIAAKRSQPAITVPAYDMHHFAPVRNLMAKMDAAGIKYTIGN